MKKYIVEATATVHLITTVNAENVIEARKIANGLGYTSYEVENDFIDQNSITVEDNPIK